jgi:hypothetical protein
VSGTGPLTAGIFDEFDHQYRYVRYAHTLP